MLLVVLLPGKHLGHCRKQAGDHWRVQHSRCQQVLSIQCLDGHHGGVDVGHWHSRGLRGLQYKIKLVIKK